MRVLTRAIKWGLRKSGYKLVACQDWVVPGADPGLARGRPHVMVGTHHKTGTVWMLNVFSQIARETGSALVQLSELPAAERAPIIRKALAEPTRQILFDTHSRFARSRRLITCAAST